MGNGTRRLLRGFLGELAGEFTSAREFVDSLPERLGAAAAKTVRARLAERARAVREGKVPPMSDGGKLSGFKWRKQP